jgi:surface antigen
MMNKYFRTGLISVVVSLLPLSLQAANDAFLSNTAMSYFTQQDWVIFNKTQNNVLNRGKNGVKVTWNNPQSGSHGYMIPAAAPSQNGLVCRYLSFYNVANLIKGEGTYRFCKANNTWKIY